MAVRKVTGDPELDAIIGSIHKQFGKENLITAGYLGDKVKPIATGALNLDIAIGLGGVPMGRIIELYGPEASGKTSLGLNIVAEYQKQRDALGHTGRRPLIVDLEHTMGLDLLKGVGVDIEDILFTKPDTAEEAFQTILNLIKTGKVGMVLLDSIDAAQSMAQLKRQVGENHMAGISKLLSEELRRLSKLAEKTDTTLIFINQIRMNPGVMFGSPVVTPGGKALKFYSSLRLETMSAKPSPSLPDAMTMRVKIVKNKHASPRKEPVEFDFIYAKGPDPALDLIATAKDLGIAYSAGPNLMLKLPGSDKGEKLAGGGTAGAAEYLRQNPEEFQRVRSLCLEIAGITDPEETPKEVTLDEDTE